MNCIFLRRMYGSGGGGGSGGGSGGGTSGYTVTLAGSMDPNLTIFAEMETSKLYSATGTYVLEKGIALGVGVGTDNTSWHWSDLEVTYNGVVVATAPGSFEGIMAIYEFELTESIKVTFTSHTDSWGTYYTADIVSA